MRRLRILIAALTLTACGVQTEPPRAPETRAAEESRSQTVDATATASETRPPARSQDPGEVRGQPVAPRVVQVLHASTKTVEAFDLGTLLGRRPIAICYALLGEPIGEEGLTRFQLMASEQERVVEQLAAPIEFMGATRIGRTYTVETASDRLAELGITMPVILEEQLDFGRALGATAAPSMSLIDKDGILRLADARNLKQEVENETSVADALWHVARGGKLPTIMELKRYYPANDLKEHPAPDFTLKRFLGTDRVTLSDHIAENKVTALLFWHPDCKPCEAVMPGIMAGYRAFKPSINLVSVVDLKGELEARNCRDTINAHGIDFPVLEDEDKLVTNQYFIVSTPTMIFIKPDGIVDSVYTAGDANYLPIMKARIKAILDLGEPS